MCGVVGFTGTRDAAPVLLDALSRLEYRGYDSAGLATINNGCLYIRKGIGKLEEVESICDLSRLNGSTGIGHVRWATHGVVSIENAHPHRDCSGQIAVAHNGIIENHEEIRNRLEAGHRFLSETDTEVIAHLIEEQQKNGEPLEVAVRKAVDELRGSYALLVTSVFEPGKVVACRNGSPLVVGLGRGENFIASDFQAFLNQTREVIFIEDGESVVINRGKVQLYNELGSRITRARVTLDHDFHSSSKEGYEFYMLKEVFEQPRAIMTAMQQDSRALYGAASMIKRSKSVVFTACGTSRYASLIGRYLFSRVSQKFSDVVIASEFGYFSEAINQNTLVIAVSQSGETADVIEGVKQARAKGAKVLSIINTVGSSLGRMSDRTLYLNCGPEIGVPATKSFIAQLVIFYLLSFAVAGRLDEVKQNLSRISGMIDTNLMLNNLSVPGLARELKNHDKFYYVARGINFAIAGEAALKLKEVAYVHAEGMPAGELKHGTLALIEQGTPVVAICPDDCTRDHILSNVSEVKARGARVIGVSDKNSNLFDTFIEVPRVDEAYYPLVSIVPLQLLAFHSAIVRGLDPDKPRNLAKSVTVK